MIALVLPAILVTTVALLALCLTDPKRTRVSRGNERAISTGTRRLLAALACLPGVALALLGEGAGFMIWLGGAGVMGWGVAAILATRRIAKNETPV